MPRACASCSITALRSGSAPASASTSTSWRLRCCPACGRASRWCCSRAHGRTGWSRTGLPGASVVDVRVPVRVLNLAWHRLEWPPVERFAGAVDVAHSTHPLLLPSRHRAVKVVTVYDLDFLDHPGRTPRRDPARLPRARGAPRAARRPGRRDLGAHGPRGPEPPRRRCRPHRALPARRAACPRTLRDRSGRDRSCSSARSSRARTCRPSLPPTRSWSRATPEPRR